MPDPLTDEQLAEWKALCEAATPGPWALGYCHISAHGIPRDHIGNDACEDEPPYAWIADVFDFPPPSQGGHGGDALFNAEAIANGNLIRVARAALPALIAEVERRRSQLPSGMEECTIQFHECEKEHGRLTASNWTDHGCHWCRIDKLEAAQSKTADGVTVVSGMKVYVGPRTALPELWPVGSEVTMRMQGGFEGEVRPEDCYSTEAAAREAKEKSDA